MFKHADQEPGFLLLQGGRERDLQAQRTSTDRGSPAGIGCPIQSHRVDREGSGVLQQVGRTVSLQVVIRQDPVQQGGVEIALFRILEKLSDPTTTTPSVRMLMIIK